MPPLGEPAETARIRKTSNLSLLSSPLLHSFASFLFPFEVAFLQKLDCEGGEGINCRSCARASLFKKQKKERVSPSGRESRSMRRGVDIGTRRYSYFNPTLSSFSHSS